MSLGTCYNVIRIYKHMHALASWLYSTHQMKSGCCEMNLVERWGNTSWKSVSSISLTLKFESNTASLAKWRQLNEEGRWGSPVLTNDVAPQGLYCIPAPLLSVLFFAEWSHRSPHIIEWIAQCRKRFSIGFAVDKCSMRCLGHIGNSMQLNLWYNMCWK